ncbi:MAG: hypothetical protein RLY61_572 [Candidatus Parcubacteria bacterium]
MTEILVALSFLPIVVFVIISNKIKFTIVRILFGLSSIMLLTYILMLNFGIAILPAFVLLTLLSVLIALSIYIPRQVLYEGLFVVLTLVILLALLDKNRIGGYLADLFVVGFCYTFIRELLYE